jgi:CheY-like chemotaxis protein
VTTAKRRAFVVDDDDDMREALRDTLAAEGYEIDVARDGQEALDYLRANPAPPVILLDWNMAPMSGPQFMAEVAKDAALSKIPVVLLTADSRVTGKATPAGFAGTLSKPVMLEDLFAVISRYCR